jgi:hypothetical protein
MEKRANYQAKMLSQGGKLILTGKHLVFKPHRFNIRAKTITIELEDIADIGKTRPWRARSLGRSPEVYVTLTSGLTERFYIWRRDEFIDAVKKQIASLKK